MEPTPNFRPRINLIGEICSRFYWYADFVGMLKNLKFWTAFFKRSVCQGYDIQCCRLKASTPLENAIAGIYVRPNKWHSLQRSELELLKALAKTRS